ncbi:hypothetical protein NLO88_05035 [Pseudomonas syringae]|nr:hypothetical protein [Pseudomonas syringae]
MKDPKDVPPSHPVKNTEPDQSFRAAYIREVPLGRDELPLAIANGGFSVVVPGVTSPSYNRVFIYPLSGTDAPYPVPIKDAFIQTGVDATLIYSSADINATFHVGDQVKIRSSFWYVPDGFWTDGPDSVLYTIVS